MRILKGIEDHLLKEQVDGLRFLILIKNPVARKMMENIIMESLKEKKITKIKGKGLFS